MSGHILACDVPGEPVTWKRARRGKGHSYTDPAQAAHMEKVRAAVRNAGFRGQPIAVPFRLTCHFFRDMNPTDQRFGDSDNLIKLVKDALNAVVWVDDRYVTLGGWGKSRHPVASTEIVIEWSDAAEAAEVAAPDRIAAQKPSDFKRILGPKAVEKLNRRRLTPSVRRPTP